MIPKIFSKKNLIPFVILIIGIIFTIEAAIYTKKDLETILKHEFVLVCNEIKTKIEERLYRHAQLLRSGSSLFAASDTITRKEWKVFNEYSKLDKNLPGIQGVGVSFIINKELLQQHIKSIRNEGFSNYTIHPAGDREIYTSVIFLEPFIGSNLQAFGYDMYSEPIRRKAMEQARDYDDVVLSDKVVLVQETDKNLQAGTVMYVPIYRKGMPISTIKERRAAILGWVYSPYRMFDLMQGILGRLDLNINYKIHLKVYDNDSISQNSLLFDSRKGKIIDNNEIYFQTITIPIVFNKQKWILQFSQSNEKFLFFQSKVLIVFIIGIIISLLLFSISMSLFKTRSNALQISEQLTLEIKEREKRYFNLLGNLEVGIVVHSPDTSIIINNPKASELLGLSDEQMRGKVAIDETWKFVNEDNTSMLLEEYPVNWIVKNKKAFRNQVIGIVQPYKDDVVWVLVNGFPELNNAGDITEIVISFTDITERKQAEEKIISSQNLLQRIIDLLPIRIFWKDNNLEYLGCNEIFAKDAGKNNSMEVIGRDDFQMGWKEQAKIYRADDLGVIKSGVSKLNYEEPQTTPEGETLWLKTSKVPLTDIHGNIIGILGSYEDITERKQVEEELNEWNIRFKKLSNNAPGLIFQFTRKPDGTYCVPIASEGIRDIFGCSPEDVVDDFTPIGNVIYPEDAAKVLADIEYSAKHLTFFTCEFRVQIPGKEIQWIYSKSNPEKLLDGSITWYGFNTDITEHKQLEEKIIANEEKYRLLVENTDTGFVTIEENGKVISANEPYKKLAGFDINEDIIGRSVMEWTAPDEKENNANAVALCAKTGYIKGFETIYQQSNGTRLNILVDASVYKSPEGHNQIISYCHNITERKQAEKELSRSEKELKKVQQITHIGSWYLDVATNEVVWTEELYKMYGFDPSLPPPPYTEHQKMFTPESWELLSSSLAHTSETGIPYELELKMVKGNETNGWMWVRGETMKDQDGKTIGLWGAAQDITDRKKAEERLRLSEQRYRLLFENYSSGFALHEIILNSEGKPCDYRFLEINPAFEVLTGLKAIDLIGKTEMEVMPNTESYWIEIYGEVALTGKVVNFENYSRDLNKHFHVIAYSPEHGKFATVFSDITERKLTEEKLKEAFENVNRSNKDLEQFAYVASHDLQEPLRMISSYTQLLERRYKDKLDQDANDFIHYAVDGAIRMQKLLNDLLDFSRIGSIAKVFEQVDTSNILEQVISNLKLLITENDVLITYDNLPIVKADESQILRVFQNFIENAIKFKKKTELPRIHISCTKQNNMYQFSVTDNGIGMEMEYHDRIFIIFQRLHSVKDYSGTGIGLSINKRIVERHGGTIWFESKINEGTTFYFTLKV